MASITKRGNSYRIKVSCGYDEHGKQVIRSMTWKPEDTMTPRQIEKEVIIQARLFEKECENGEAPHTKPVKFSIFVDTWLSEYAERNLKKTTLTFQRLLAKRTCKAIGHIRVDKITTNDIQRFIDSLAKDGENQNTGERLSRKTLTHYRSFVSSVLEYAIRKGMRTSNPCKAVTIPRGSKKERKIYTIDEMQQLFQLLAEHAPSKYLIFFLLAAETGMRRGELLGLEWKDFDFEKGTVHVRRTSNYTKRDGAYTDTPKTAGSDRIILFNRDIIPSLIAYKEEQDVQKEAMGDKWIDNDRLFVSENGSPMSVGTPYSWLERFCKAHSFPFYGIHQFRHFYASVSIGVGNDITTVSKNMGHSQCSTTLNIYSHQVSEYLIKAREKYDNAIQLSEIISKKSE